MTIKTLSAIAMVTAALSSPVFAQAADMQGAGAQKPVHALRHYHNSYNSVQTPSFVAPRESTGVSGTYLDNESVDHSRIGGHDPDVNPAS
jgi:hypothetical protein